MKRLLTILLVLSIVLVYGQDIKPAGRISLQAPNNVTWDYNSSDQTIGMSKGAYKWNKFFSAKKVQFKIDSLDIAKQDILTITTIGTSGPSTLVNGVLNIPQYVGGGESVMVYPSAGIPISTGSAWGASITNNSANWNTAYGWGNHAGLYAPISGSANYQAPIAAGTTSQYWRGDKTWQTFPTIPTTTSQLTNNSGFLTSYTETDPNIYSWARASTKPSYSYPEITGTPPSADGNNYPTSLSYSGTTLTLGRNGLSSLTATISGGMTYPSGSGIPIVSGGSSWGTTITNNSTNWNTAYTNMGKSSIYGSSSYYQLASYYFKVSGSEIIPDVTNTLSSSITLPISSSAVASALSFYQPKLVSGTSIKTVNGNSLLGSGNLSISASATWGGIGGTLSTQTDLNSALAGKASIYGNGSNYFFASEYFYGGTTRWVTSAVSGGDFEIKYGSDAGGYIQKARINSLGNWFANNYYLSSDRRLKQNIKPITFSNIDKVRFVQFDMINDSTHRTRYGVVAQDIEAIVPELVHTDSKGMKSVAYTDLLIAKVSQLSELINSLEKRIKQLENEK